MEGKIKCWSLGSDKDGKEETENKGDWESTQPHLSSGKGHSQAQSYEDLPGTSNGLSSAVSWR